MTTVAEIRFGEPLSGQAGSVSDEGAQHFGLPADMEASLDAFVRPYGFSAAYLLECHERETRRRGPWPWALIFFAEEHPLAGHVASLRGAMRNAAMVSYTVHQRIIAGDTQPAVPAVAGVLVRKKAVLRTLAEKSPMFRPAWEALKNKTDVWRWICLSDPPPPRWVAAKAPGDEALYRQHRGRSMEFDASNPSLFANQEWGTAYRLGMELFVAGSWARCTANLKQVASQAPNTAEAWCGLGLACAELGDLDEAIAALTRAIELQPYWINTRMSLARACRNRKLYSRVEAECLRVLEIDPFTEDAWALLAAFRAERGQYAEAVAAYERYLELEPRSADGWGGYGRALFRCNRREEGVSAYAKRVEVAPDSVVAWSNLGHAQAQVGRCREALRSVEKAIELDPAASFAWDSLGYAHLMAGHCDQAIAACLKAIELRPEHPDAWRHLVHAYLQSQDEQKFKASYLYLKSINRSGAERIERELASGTIA